MPEEGELSHHPRAPYKCDSRIATPRSPLTPPSEARIDSTRRGDVPPDLPLIFQAHALIAGLVGAQHLIFPRFWTNLAGMEIDETVTWRLIGAALLALAVASWLAAGEREWARVRIVVILEIVWSTLAAVVITWGILAEGLPPLEWVNVAIVAAFAAAFSWMHHRAPEAS